MNNNQVCVNDVMNNSTSRILMQLLLLLIVMASVVVYYTYTSRIHSDKDAEFNKLQAVTRTIANQINGDLHSTLVHRFQSKDEVKANKQDPIYYKIHSLLKGAKKSNNLTSDVYTLVLVDDSRFEFVATSADIPYYRHRWDNIEMSYLNQYEDGGNYGPYETPRGTWLSAFSPIKDSNGKTVAIVQADQEFDSFIASANMEVKKEIGMIVVILMLIFAYMMHHIEKVLSKEDTIKEQMAEKNRIIELKSRDLIDSINSAQKIQNSMFSVVEDIKKSMPEVFIMNKPRDVVSGDFFWFSKKDDRSYFAVADCTGHGVPGAFMSMVGYTMLNEIINSRPDSSPADILKRLNKRITKTFYRMDGSGSRDGMDIGLCCYHHDSGELEFSGALRPLIVVSNGSLEKIRPDRFSIGGNDHEDKIFTNYKVLVSPGDTLYMYSDGYHDQFGGERGKKYQSKRFRNLLQQANELHIEDQKYLLQYEFHLWKQKETQVDDVLVAGFKIPTPDSHTLSPVRMAG